MCFRVFRYDYSTISAHNQTLFVVCIGKLLNFEAVFRIERFYKDLDLRIHIVSQNKSLEYRPRPTI
jgi:hypothetical protein